MLAEDAVYGDRRDRHLMKALQVVRDLPGAEVILLAQ
jgi:hypothetical protein